MEQQTLQPDATWMVGAARGSDVPAATVIGSPPAARKRRMLMSITGMMRTSRTTATALARPGCPNVNSSLYIRLAMTSVSEVRRWS